MNMYVRILIACVPFVLASCAPALLGGIGVGGYSVMQERTVGNFIDDNTVWAKISSLYVQEDVNELFGNIDVEVNEGRVLLTGQVMEPESRVEAVRTAWQVEGVKEVINEIQVSDQSSIKDYAKDIWIGTQISTKLLLDKSISSVNYSVETVNGVVYLLGIAQSEEELDEVTHLVGTVKGVKKVISHVRLKNDPLRQ